MTALHIATSGGFEKIVRILLQHGANVNLQDKVLIFIFLCWLCLCDIDFVFVLF